ncbi:hypothetical protein CVT25_015805 [Psilocybe cyanescens]|uniref:Uncharacterized protein n=1 Tax=Psilocybe cyanescens TaxID=93625 RepID=A0A409X1I9_PSICY|nr:hypothetical protein CVT25_015805 [Psilocybe cyanescens]
MEMSVPEMGRNLKQMVENTLEESQFENAIALLDQIRSKDHTPSTILLLHVIFISLHSTSHPSRLDDPTEPVVDHATLLLQSPRKMMKQSKSSVLLSPHAVVAAHRLLHAFIRTNGPAALADAIPYYPQSKHVQPCEYDYIDSPIHTQAVALKNARSVWDVLQSDFIVKTYRATHATQKARPKQPRASALGKDASFTDWSAQEDIQVVGEHSWHTLDWFVALFEADAQQSSFPKHSTLLLKQLPPPPIGSHTRWDASEPLKVVFYAFKQKDPRRQRTGLRLLNLLLDLAQTPHLNLPSFASTALSQMAVAATPAPPHTHQAVLTDLLTRLAFSTPPALAFKITLCKKILSLLQVQLEEADPSVAGTDGPPPLSGGSAATTVMSECVSNGGQDSAAPPSPAKPRIRPRPLARKVADVNADADAKSKGKGKEKETEKEKEKDKAKEKGAAAKDAGVPGAGATAPLAQAHIQTALPPLSDIARLVRLAALPTPPPASSSTVPNSDLGPKSNSRQTRRTSTPKPPAPARENDEGDEPLSPWTSPPALLLRVKFELVRAWIGVRSARRAAGVVAKQNKNKEEREREKEDAELMALIEDVFGSGSGGGGGGKAEEDAVYEKERAFYRDALRVFSGC